MEKYFNTVSMLFGLVGGVITGILGGLDVLMKPSFREKSMLLKTIC
ncbi:MAG: hypothetical protein IKG56_01500 [Clostridia bacterium]|nr:hypothetical protein [Clostridia bacterium]